MKLRNNTEGIPNHGAARDAAILQDLDLVNRIARRFQRRVPPCVTFDDLASAGMIGLIHAVDRFDQTRGLKFRTYARSTESRERCRISSAMKTRCCELNGGGLPPLLSDYAAYRKAHNGAAEATVSRDLDTARRFLQHLRSRRRSITRLGLQDIDTFVQAIAAHVSTSTVADTCSSLRAFLRFLQTSGRLDSNLASGVMAPRFRASARLPRTLPWRDVKRILRAVRRSDPTGRRDFAMLLLLATYGLGAAEILALRLEDLDWRAGVLRVRRPKTKVDIELPLLPAVARALTAYLRWERPPAKGIARVFLRRRMPYAPITSGAIRHRLRLYAKRAGVSAKVGTHIFRHSHASRQIDAGANLKVVSEILGHRSSSSTSVYVRVALRRLRGIGLPVPR